MNHSDQILQLQETFFTSQTILSINFNRLPEIHKKVQRQGVILSNHTDPLHQVSQEYKRLTEDYCLPYKIASLSKKKRENKTRLERLKSHIQRLTEQLEKLKTLEKTLYGSLKGYPSETTLELLRCPLSKKPLTDAIRFPSGTVVSAASLGLCTKEGKLVKKGSLEEIQRLFNETTVAQLVLKDFCIEEPIGDFFFQFPESFERFCTKLPVVYAICELANQFANAGGEIEQKPLEREWLEDPVTSDLYDSPQTLSCGHTVSKKYIEKNTDCYCRAKITSQTQNAVIETFIHDYQLLNPREILTFRLEEVEEKLKQHTRTHHSLIQLREELEKAKEFHLLQTAVRMHGIPIPMNRRADIELMSAQENYNDAQKRLEELTLEKPQLEKERMEIPQRLRELPTETAKADQTIGNANAQLKQVKEKLKETAKRLKKATQRMQESEKKKVQLTKQFKEMRKLTLITSPTSEYLIKAKERFNRAADEFVKHYDLYRCAKRELNELLEQCQEASSEIDRSQKEILKLI